MPDFLTTGQPALNVALPVLCAPHIADTVQLDEKSHRMMLAIREVTEKIRLHLQSQPMWGSFVSLPARGVKPFAKPSTLADQLQWPCLLTMDVGVDEASQMAGCSRGELLSFAMLICPYEHLPHLVQYVKFKEGIQEAAKLLSPVIRTLKAKETRIKQGASVGGRKSAVTRAKLAKTPSLEILQAEAEKLVRIGKLQSEINGILSVRYGVTPNTIRRKLKKA